MSRAFADIYRDFNQRAQTMVTHRGADAVVVVMTVDIVGIDVAAVLRTELPDGVDGRSLGGALFIAPVIAATECVILVSLR